MNYELLKSVINYLLTILTILFMVLTVCYYLALPKYTAEVIDVQTEIVKKTYLIGAKVLVPVEKYITEYTLTLRYTDNSEEHITKLITDNPHYVGEYVTISVSNKNIYLIKTEVTPIFNG